MALDNIEALEARIHSLVKLVHNLKAQNLRLEEELRVAKDRLLEQTELSQQWNEERTNIRARIEKVLSELEFFECLEESRFSKEVAID